MPELFNRDDDESRRLQDRFTEVEQLRDLDWMAGQARVIPAASGRGNLLEELRAQMQARQGAAGPQMYQPSARQPLQQPQALEPAPASTGAPQPAPSASAPVAGKTQYGFTGPELAGQMDMYLQDASKGFPEGHQISEDDVIADFFQAVETGLIPKADVRNLIQDYRQTEQGGEVWRNGAWQGMPFTRAPVKK